MILDLKTLATLDIGQFSNAQLGAALRVRANPALVKSKRRLRAVLGSNYMADHPELWKAALDVIDKSMVDADQPIIIYNEND